MTLYRLYFNDNFDSQAADYGTMSSATTTSTQVYYKNLYNLYVKTDRTDNELKKRLISEYFRLSTAISDNKLKPKSQLFISKIFNNVVRTCEDILPELAGYLKTLPQQHVKIETEQITRLSPKSIPSSSAHVKTILPIIFQSEKYDIITPARFYHIVFGSRDPILPQYFTTFLPPFYHNLTTFVP